ncbi:ankyrin repeat protein, putative [Trichomonas vaginalis G3]|uniref:Ankyrin repeat protein, putative n=1 Tax=Trichomonas vaginalis (strain ATCC PRA-98 / G3) TaxID=412133 RepID=A2GJS4_TRIV3|nr:spectrin binding [Trichomonas vaginalis G3]EAX82593.1 ankyrin repeat protein, putative [Trichomonas vaginalis G3]KAI5494110.1 spectrin binding [Trichomonas vaginalis G3]|eukprot:XP_001295523.1 ankyrin repeat protein [Trichomonas vaginalis G3]
MNLLKEILSRLTGNLQYDDISHESPKNHSIQHQDFNSSKLFTKVYRILENAAEENDTKTIIEYVKNNGWQITQKNGTNCILYAAYKGNLKLVRLLQENGADPCSKNDEDVTILHYFCHNGSIEGVEFALRFINVNAITKTTKRTPLHIAAHGNYDQLCTFLCNQKGIKKDEKDSENLTPLGLALIEGKADAQRALRAKNCRSCI